MISMCGVTMCLIDLKVASEADTGTATQKLQEARVDVLPASDQFERGMRKLRSLH